jgi:L-rhamnose mutarotase
MTYKEMLNLLAKKTAETYDLYLQAKISTLIEDDDLSADQAEQHRAESERLEKKLAALMATIKNDGSINDEAPGNFFEDFIK